jgi:hypothetical protein
VVKFTNSRNQGSKVWALQISYYVYLHKLDFSMKKCGSKSQCSIDYISFILAQIPQHPNNKSRSYIDQNTNFKSWSSKQFL